MICDGETTERLTRAGIVPLAERAGELQKHFGIWIIHEFCGGGEDGRCETRLRESQGVDADARDGVGESAFDKLRFEGVETVESAEGVEAGEFT